MSDAELKRARELAELHWTFAPVSMCQKIQIRAEKLLGIQQPEVGLTDSPATIFNELAAAFRALDAELTALKEPKP